MNKYFKAKLAITYQVLSFCIFFNYTINTLDAQTIYTEAFSSVTPPNLPGGWTRSTNETLIRTANFNPQSNGYGGASAGNHIFAPNCTPVGEMRWFMVEGISTLGATGLTASFGQRWTGAFDVPILFEWSLDGSSWNTISTNLTTESSMDWHQVSFILPSAAENQMDLRFRWSYTTDNNNNCVTATPNYRLDDFTLSATALPVELIEFKAEEKNNLIHLSWATASEINSDIFEIERSKNGMKFHRIGKVNAAGFSNENRNYLFKDESPYVGKNFYRLKQIDFDGTYEYSEIKLVSTNFSKYEKINIHTNTNQLFIQNIEIDENIEIEIFIYDYLGRPIFAKKVIENNGTVEININHLIPGAYILIINDNGQILNKRFFKN